MSLKYILALPGLIVIMLIGVASAFVLLETRNGYEEAREAIAVSQASVLRLKTIYEISEGINSTAMSVAAYSLMKAPKEQIDQIAQKAHGLGESLLAAIKELQSVGLNVPDEQQANYFKLLENYNRAARDGVAGVMQNPAFGALRVRSAAAEFQKLIVVQDALLKSLQNDEAAVAARIQEKSSLQFRYFLTLLALVTVVAVIGAYLATGYMVKPIRTATEIMQRLAQGHFEVGIPFTDRANEIGAMARALEVFKTNGINFRELNAKEAALQAKAGALQSSINGVVKAAAAGDFSRRIEANYDNEELDTFAASVNRLMTSVERGVAETRNVMSSLANGDLTREMCGDFHGVFSELQNNVNAGMVNLRDMLDNISSATATINGGSAEIHASAINLSKRSEQQAAALEETSAALAEMTEAVKHSARRSHEASAMVNDTLASTKKSADIVNSAIAAMERIKQASSEISQITGMIDEIAFQTNLLALNAGVEAARAGEAGKGFAVVAQEVRDLAQRSAKAAKEISALISRTTHEVASGVQLVVATGSALTKIEADVGKVDSHVQSIARSANEQSAGLEEINAAINEIDQVTQANAAMVEETTAATTLLADQADHLAGLIARFKIGAPTRVEEHHIGGAHKAQQFARAS